MRANLIALDETKDWTESIQEKAGKLYTVYLYNPNEKTHYCEITPSYYLIPLYAFAEKEIDDETQGDLLEGIASEDPHYYHCHSIDSIPKKNKEGMRIRYSGSGFENMEEAQEYYQMNYKL